MKIHLKEEVSGKGGRKEMLNKLPLNLYVYVFLFLLPLTTLLGLCETYLLLYWWEKSNGEHLYLNTAGSVR